MTDKIEDQDIIGDLHGDENNVEEAHDPKNAETQAVKAVDAAGNATKAAPKRKGDKGKQDPPATVGKAIQIDRGRPRVPDRSGRVPRSG